MIYTQDNFKIDKFHKKNYRALCVKDNHFFFTAFPEKVVYEIDFSGTILNSHPTQYFYGSLSYNETSKHWVAGCYGESNTEIHLLDDSFKKLKSINYYPKFSLTQKDRLDFVSFCNTCFSFHKSLYFSLQHGESLYCLEDGSNSILEINLAQKLNITHLTHFHTICHDSYFVSLIGIEKEIFLLKYLPDFSFFSLHPLPFVDGTTSIFHIEIYNKMLYITHGNINYSFIRVCNLPKNI